MATAEKLKEDIYHKESEEYKSRAYLIELVSRFSFSPLSCDAHLLARLTRNLSVLKTEQRACSLIAGSGRAASTIQTT